MRASLFLCCPIAALWLSGCIVVPLPHVTTRSPNLKGCVRDAESGQPLAGATVALITHKGQSQEYAHDENPMGPGASVRTRKDGSFHISRRFNFHLLWYANPSWSFHLPFGSYWNGESIVNKDGYASRSLNSQEDLRDVRLTAEQ